MTGSIDFNTVFTASNAVGVAGTVNVSGTENVSTAAINVQYVFTPVPEPGGFIFFGLGVLFLMRRARSLKTV